MAFMPSFLKKEVQKKENSPEPEKKIDFAQKLPEGDLEGASSRKGGNFDFLKGLSKRKDGEAVPITLHPEQPAEEDARAEEENEDFGEEKENSKKNWFSGFFKARLEPEYGNGKKSSRALEVNLVRGEIVKFFDWQKGVTLLVISVFISLTIISFIYWGISWWGASKQSADTNAYLQDYYRVSKEIRDLDPQVAEVLQFKGQLDLVSFLLDRHVYWTNFFNFLEDNTLADVHFSVFSGDINGQYSMQATADNLDAIDAQIKKFLANPIVKNAQVNAGSISGDKGNQIVVFTLSFALNPAIFLEAGGELK